MKRTIVALVAAFLFVFGSVAPVAADHKAGHQSNGANQSGDFTANDPPTEDTSNDHGNRPSDGSVGKADDKNPPGQSHKPEDKNAGYECDRNNGVGKGNPAHSACEQASTPTTVKDKTPPTTVKDNTKTSSTVIEREQQFEARVRELKAQQAATAGVVTPEPEDTAVTPEAQLAYTGTNETLAGIGILFLMIGMMLLAASKRRA